MRKVFIVQFADHAEETLGFLGAFPTFEDAETEARAFRKRINARAEMGEGIYALFITETVELT